MSESSKTFIPDFVPQKQETYPKPPPRIMDGPFVLEEFTSRPGEGKESGQRFVFDSEEARNFDETSVKKAREGVIEILRNAMNKARTQARQIKQEAYNEGHEAGRQEGFQKGEQEARVEFEPFLETLQGTIQDLSAFRKKMFGKVEREMMEIVIDLAKKVIQHELSIREDSVQDMIRLAVQSVMDRERMNIRVHPQDKTYAESYRPEIHRMFGGIKNISFEADPSLQRGGCIIETNFGTVDARIEKLNDQIEKILNLAPPPLEAEETQATEKQD